jgi:hypothetical protein
MELQFTPLGVQSSLSSSKRTPSFYLICFLSFIYAGLCATTAICKQTGVVNGAAKDQWRS